MSESETGYQSSSDLEDYNPIEETAEMRSMEQYSADNLSIIDQNTDGINYSNSKTDLIPASRTFSSDLISNYDDLELEYDSFSGSITDYADKPVEPPAVEVVESKSMGSLTCDTTAETEYDSTLHEEIIQEERPPKETSADQDKENQDIPKLSVIKNRARDTSTIDLAQIEKFRRVSSKFTTIKISDPVIETKLVELNKQFDDLSLKIHKIDKEIKFLDTIIPLSSTPSSGQSFEFKKLNYAREKLFEKSELLKKEKYELGIKLNDRFKKVYGVNGADKAQYWIRGVSR